MRRVVLLGGLLLLVNACGDGAQEGGDAGEARRDTAAAVGSGAAGDPVAKDAAMHDPRPTNRLIHEKSPYLLQHAHNPVDWYPWGEEAFAKARRENKPIFLSIGYSTCHWCHVMERESFANEAIAAYLNAHFVPIKVDREERPDIDRVYMTFVQATTGGGGWPLNVWLTPDLKPFFGGTYFPPERRGNRPGFSEVLHVIQERWQANREELLQSADRVVAELRRRGDLAARHDSTVAALDAGVLETAYAMQKRRFDPTYGGFGDAPKFPRPSELLFLHRIHHRSDDAEALRMSRRTLEAMEAGGIHDQLGGGFHRYSTDAAWLVPHFEKMLYDQAQLTVAYLEMFQLTGEPRFAAVARDILDYVRRNLRDPGGGFYSAEDADSALDPAHPEDKLEGAYYVWRASAIDSVLDPPLAALARAYYGVEDAGNIRSAELRGYNVLHVAEPLEKVAAALGLDPETARRRLETARQRLLEARAARPRPHRDDKVLTAWNGLMISAYARAARVLDRPEELETAVQAAAFVLEHLRDPASGRLLRRWRLGSAEIPGFNADYAFLIQGLLDLFEASNDVRWLETARELTELQIAHFEDPEAGGFFETTDEDSTVLLRTKEDYDGAEPTSNSVSALNLLRLAEMLDEPAYRERARRILALYAPTLQRFGMAMPAMLVALDFELAAPRQVIIAGRPGAEDTRALLATVNARFLPHAVLLLADGAQGQAALARHVPLLENIAALEGRATAYVCQNYTCQLPVHDPQDLARQLETK